MHEHGPNCLEGPIRGSYAWWRGLDKHPEPDENPGQKSKKKGTKADRTGIREELVERIRREIAAGTYETPEKWQAALDRLLMGLGGSEE